MQKIINKKEGINYINKHWKFIEDPEKKKIYILMTNYYLNRIFYYLLKNFEDFLIITEKEKDLKKLIRQAKFRESLLKILIGALKLESMLNKINIPEKEFRIKMKLKLIKKENFSIENSVCIFMHGISSCKYDDQIENPNYLSVAIAKAIFINMIEKEFERNKIKIPWYLIPNIINN